MPNPVVPASTICVQLEIPDAPEYRQAFRGFLSDLGKYWSWSHTVGQSNDNAMAAAELWRKAGQTIVYGQCGIDPMSCDDVTDCIETNEGTQSAIQAIVGNQATPGLKSTPGARLPDAVWSENLADTSECDYDSFWAQCMRFVDYLVPAGNDLLEQIELYSNGLEAVGFVEAIPVIGTFIDETQADQFLDMLDWVMETVTEWYAAADTQANRIDMACALFCANRDDCNLSLEETWNILNSRLGGIFNPSDLQSVPDLINAATTLMSSPTVPLDAWVLFVISVSRVMGYVGIKGVEKTLNIMLKVAADQPNDDWIALCEDCPVPEDCPPEGDFTTGAHGWTSATGSADYTVYHFGEGFGRGNTVPNRIGIRLPQSGTVSQIKIKWNTAYAGVMDISTFNYSGRLFQTIVGIPNEEWTIDTEGLTGGVLIDTYPQFEGSDWPSDARLICVTLIP